MCCSGPGPGAAWQGRMLELGHQCRRVCTKDSRRRGCSRWLGWEAAASAEEQVSRRSLPPLRILPRQGHHRAASGFLCSSSFFPSSPLAWLTQTGGWRWMWRCRLASGSDPLVFCLSGLWNPVCEKSPFLCVSERGCSFWGTLRVLSPMTLIWLLKVQMARGPPQDWVRRMGFSSSWCVDGKPAHGQEKRCDLEAGSI